MDRIKNCQRNNFEIEPDPVQPPPELPGSEKIGLLTQLQPDCMGVELLLIKNDA